MKSQLIYKCILGSVAFFSQITTGITLEATLFEKQFNQSTMDVEVDIRSIAENIQKTIQDILSISPDQQTFENTLRPWNQLSAHLKRAMKLLNELAETQSPQGEAASRALGDLNMFLREIVQNSQLSNTLVRCAEKLLYDQGLNPFQQYIVGRFFNNAADGFAYLQGVAQEKNSDGADFTVLNFESSRELRGRASDLVEKILSTDADVVCIPGAYTDDLDDLYEVLQNTYAHFSYMDAYAVGLTIPEHGRMGGFLIASKYPLEKVQLSRLRKNATNLNEGLVNFVIKNGDTALGHIYAVNLESDPSSSIQVSKFIEIIKKMQDDFLKAETSIPFFLCGDFSTLPLCEESKILMDTYFFAGSNITNTVRAVLFQTLPAFLGNDNFERSLLTTSVVTVGSRSGLRAVVRKEDHACDGVLIGRNWSENDIILCDGHAEVTIDKDSEGNSSAGGSLSTSMDTDYGTFSAEVSGGVQQDKDGNTSSHVEGTISWDW